jgi:hypothetical protein
MTSAAPALRGLREQAPPGEATDGSSSLAGIDDWRPEMTRRRFTVLAVLVALVTATSASAASIGDPNDTPGKLDLRTVTGVRSQAGLLTVTLRTWNSWSNGTLPASNSPNRLYALFSIDADNAVEYQARIVSVGGALVAVVSGQGNQFEPVPVTRLSATKVRFTFPEDVLVGPNEPLRVAARSVFRGGSACPGACTDRAPNSGFLVVVHSH